MKAALALALLGLLACALAQSHDGTFFIEDDPRGGDPRDHREHRDERDHRDHRDSDYDMRRRGYEERYPREREACTSFRATAHRMGDHVRILFEPTQLATVATASLHFTTAHEMPLGGQLMENKQMKYTKLSQADLFHADIEAPASDAFLLFQIEFQQVLSNGEVQTCLSKVNTAHLMAGVEEEEQPEEQGEIGRAEISRGWHGEHGGFRHGRFGRGFGARYGYPYDAYGLPYAPYAPYSPYAPGGGQPYYPPVVPGGGGGGGIAPNPTPDLGTVSHACPNGYAFHAETGTCILAGTTSAVLDSMYAGTGMHDGMVSNNFGEVPE